MRTADELMAVPDPAWPGLAAELADGRIEVLPVDPAAGRECLYRLQVTARSRLGALALHTGGLMADHGWLRILGGGSAERGLPSLAEANGLAGDSQRAQVGPPALLVGFDVLGGRFEVGGADPAASGRPGEPGELCYFAPDTLSWLPLGTGHSGWLSWLAAGGTTEFYADLRWPGWQDEMRGLAGDHGIACYPFLWSAQAQADLSATTRRPVPLGELFALNADFAARFGARQPRIGGS
jgi:hypothetical protein